MQRRHVLVGVATGPWLAGRASAQADHLRVAVPFYRPAQAMQGLYRHWLLPRALAFADRAGELPSALAADCGAAVPDRARKAWIDVLGAWEMLATVPLGPLIERRSIRTLDFQPTRAELIERAIAKAPRGAEEMARVGTPAKGIPALEWLLWSQPASRRRAAPDACGYAVEVARELAREASSLADAVTRAAEAEWDEARGDKAFAELLNQWIGALERLRWAQIDKPRREAATRGLKTVPYPRSASGQTAQSWRRQWDVIAELSAATVAQAPRPGEGLVPLETYLRGRGLNPLADRLRGQVGRAGAALALAGPGSPARLDGAVREMATLKALSERDVAAAVGVSIGFSDADGD